MAKKNILILNYEYPPLGGGAGVCAKYQAEGLAQLGHKVTVVTTWFQGEKEIDFTNGVELIRLKSRRRFAQKSNPIEMLSWAWAAIEFLKEFCSQNHFDICLAHFSLPGGAVAYELKRKCGIPYIVISHGMDIPWLFPRQMFFYHLPTYFWIRAICRASKANVLLTQAMKKVADRFLGPRFGPKNRVIPNGCDTAVFQPTRKKHPTAFKILFIGRLVAVKDPFTFLRALAILSKGDIPFQATIIGDGPLRAKMEAFTLENGLASRVHFSGWLSKEKIAEEYQSSNVQVISSRFEAMSISALEGLCSGIWLFSTPIGGIEEIVDVDRNGSIFDFGDHRGLASQLGKHYRDIESKNKVPDAEAIFLFRKKYSWENVIQQYDALINEKL